MIKTDFLPLLQCQAVFRKRLFTSLERQITSFMQKQYFCRGQTFIPLQLIITEVLQVHDLI